MRKFIPAFIPLKEAGKPSVSFRRVVILDNKETDIRLKQAKYEILNHHKMVGVLLITLQPSYNGNRMILYKGKKRQCQTNGTSVFHPRVTLRLGDKIKLTAERVTQNEDAEWEKMDYPYTTREALTPNHNPTWNDYRKPDSIVLREVERDKNELKDKISELMPAIYGDFITALSKKL